LDLVVVPDSRHVFVGTPPTLAANISLSEVVEGTP
jgi:hypothetical protein